MPASSDQDPRHDDGHFDEAIKLPQRLAVREAIAIGMLTLGAMTVLSLMSYYPQDVSLNAAAGDALARTHNWIGPVGAIWADLCLQGLGLVAWVLAGTLLYVGAKTLLRRTISPQPAHILCFALVTVSVGTLMELLLVGHRNPYPMGGLFGALCARGLRQSFAPVGAAVIAAACALMSLTVCFGGVMSALAARLATQVTQSVVRRVSGRWRQDGERLAQQLAHEEERVLGALDTAWAQEAAHPKPSGVDALNAVLVDVPPPLPAALTATTQADEPSWAHSTDALPSAEDDAAFNGPAVDHDAAAMDMAMACLSQAEHDDQGPATDISATALTDTLHDEGLGSDDGPILDGATDNALAAALAPPRDEPPMYAPPGLWGDTEAPPPAWEAQDAAPPIDNPEGGAQALETLHALIDGVHGPAEPDITQMSDAELEALTAPPPLDVAPVAHQDQQLQQPQQPQEPLAAATGAVGRALPTMVSAEATPYTLPPLSLLGTIDTLKSPVDAEVLQNNALKLTRTLKEYGIEGHVREIRPGPVVTMYEFVPGPGIKVSRIAGLADDLAMSMEALRVRIVAPIPGKGAVGIEIPNEVRETVYFKEIIAHSHFTEPSSPLTMALGKDIEGCPAVADLARMPHLLVAGATGAGKSVSINAMIMSVLYKATPSQVRMIMVDPKMLELSVYEGIPHLLLPVVTDAKKAAMALRWAVEEMERRYELLSEVGVRNIDSYNAKEQAGRERGEPLTVAGADPDGLRRTCEALPYLLVIVDELADLMMVASRDVETSIMRLAQMARAAGIHLVLATQRPSVDVLTGVIKANFPTRIAFQVASRHDSRTIIDAQGAEHLLGRGDMLYMSSAAGGVARVHGAYVSEDDVERTVAYVRAQGQPTYDESILTAGADDADNEAELEALQDEMYDQAVAVVAESQQASISMIQRRLRIGYNRAARMVERMEIEGIVGPADGAKPREVIVAHHGD